MMEVLPPVSHEFTHDLQVEQPFCDTEKAAAVQSVFDKLTLKFPDEVRTTSISESVQVSWDVLGKSGGTASPGNVELGSRYRLRASQDCAWQLGCQCA